MAGEPTRIPKADLVRTEELCDLFLEYAEKHTEPATYRWYKYFLKNFSGTGLHERLPDDLIKLVILSKLDRERLISLLNEDIDELSREELLSKVNELRGILKVAKTITPDVIAGE